MKNIFITGEKQIGKSTLLKRVITSLNLNCSGFVTLPYYINEKRRGYYLHSLIPIKENDIPITVQPNDVMCYPLPQTFDTLGVKILKESLSSSNQIILMDEIGVAERTSNHFLDALRECLDSDKLVIGVLKEKSCAHIEDIKQRKDTLVFEINKNNRDHIYGQLLTILQSKGDIK